jgi:hypothetical protein
VHHSDEPKPDDNGILSSENYTGYAYSGSIAHVHIGARYVFLFHIALFQMSVESFACQAFMDRTLFVNPWPYHPATFVLCSTTAWSRECVEYV